MGQSQPRFCHLCGQQLHGSYLVYEGGLAVCERCNHTVPHCSRCKTPSLQLTSVRGVPVCPACLRKLTVCACCRVPILSNYYIIGDSPAKYCEVCVQTRPRCDICRAPLDEQGKVFQGRREKIYRCSSCFSTAVTTDEEAKRLYQETYELLRRELKLDIPILPLLHLTDRATLNAMHQQSEGIVNAIASPGAENQHLLGFFRRMDADWAIYIEYYLPQTLFRAVAAHELAHAWQSSHTASDQAAKIVEGFAEWVAYCTMLILGEQRTAARLTRRSDLYGEGLQYFIALERKYGRQGTLQRATLRNP